MKKIPIETIQIVIAAATLFSGVILTRVSYQTFIGGPIPAKHLNSSMFFSGNTISELKTSGNNIVATITDANGNNITNLYIPAIILRNTGASPILPSEFYGNVKLSTKEPWSIVGITSGSGAGKPSLNWHKINNTEFEAEPSLLNPGDIVFNKVYMTSSITQTDTYVRPPLEWSARIANLAGIEYDEQHEAMKLPVLLPVSVSYDGNEVLFVMVVFSIYLSVFIYYISTSGYFSSTIMTVLYVVAASVFSIMSADVTKSYLFDSVAIINNVLNAPILLMNFIALCWILWKIHSKRAIEMA
jgi:hypothetical protein